MFLSQPQIYVLLCYEFMDIPIQPVSDLFFSWIPVMRHHRSLMQIPSPGNGTIYGFVGPDLGSALVSQTNPYTTSPFSINLWSIDWSLTWRSMVGCWNQVSAPWDGHDVGLYPLFLLSCRSLDLGLYQSSPLFRPSVPLWRSTIDLP